MKGRAMEVMPLLDKVRYDVVFLPILQKIRNVALFIFVFFLFSQWRKISPEYAGLCRRT